MWSPDLTAAFDYASSLHRTQVRKGTEIPYLAHLLGVASQVLDWGGEQPAVMAALLHDTVEDHGGTRTLDEIRSRFGSRVAALVEACTDSLVEPKPLWRERKQRYIDGIPDKAPEALLVIGADKLHNLRAIERDYRVCGDDLWERFSGRKEGTLWYYRELCRVFNEIGLQPAGRELAETYQRLMEAVAARDGNGRGKG